MSTQLARNNGLQVCVNHKVDTTAFNSNKQSDIQAMQLTFQDMTTWYEMRLLVIGLAAACSMASMASYI